MSKITKLSEYAVYKQALDELPEIKHIISECKDKIEDKRYWAAVETVYLTLDAAILSIEEHLRNIRGRFDDAQE